MYKPQVSYLNLRKSDSVVRFKWCADSCVGLVVDLALSEMFGTVAEEKEVAKITGKLAEAKGTKSYDSIQIVARYLMLSLS